MMDFIENFSYNYSLIVLLILLLLVILGVWLWRRRAGQEEPYSDHDFYADSYFDDDLTAEKHADLSAQTEDHFVPPDAPRETAQPDAGEMRTSEAQTRTESTAPKSPLIIALYIHANHTSGFNGVDVYAAMERLGLEFGKMNIFHHYGLEENHGQDPVFSIANLLEPGTFDTANPESFATTGLVAFMQLPGPLGGRVAFELMLNNAQRLADILRGNLENDRRQPLDAEGIEFLRRGIDEFEQA